MGDGLRRGGLRVVVVGGRRLGEGGGGRCVCRCVCRRGLVVVGVLLHVLVAEDGVHLGVVVDGHHLVVVVGGSRFVVVEGGRRFVVVGGGLVGAALVGAALGGYRRLLVVVGRPWC